MMLTPLHSQDARYLTPFDAGVPAAAASSHVRALVLSPAPITSVRMWLDGSPLAPASHAGRGLYVAPWQPNRLAPGVHVLRVRAEDAMYQSRTVELPISVDGTAAPFTSAFSVWVLTGNLRQHVRDLVIVGVVCLAAILLGTRLLVMLLQKRTPVERQRALGSAWRTLCVQQWLSTHMHVQEHQRAPAATPRMGGTVAALSVRASRALAHTFVPYVHLCHKRPALFNACIAGALYTLLGPLYAGRFYAGEPAVLFSWGIVTHKYERRSVL